MQKLEEDVRGQEKQDNKAQELDTSAAGANELAHEDEDVEEDDDGDPFEASAGSEAKANPSSTKKVNDATKYDEDFEPD
jgi:hypothetical protein